MAGNVPFADLLKRKINSDKLRCSRPRNVVRSLERMFLRLKSFRMLLAVVITHVMGQISSVGCTNHTPSVSIMLRCKILSSSINVVYSCFPFTVQMTENSVVIKMWNTTLPRFWMNNSYGEFCIACCKRSCEGTGGAGCSRSGYRHVRVSSSASSDKPGSRWAVGYDILNKHLSQLALKHFKCVTAGCPFPDFLLFTCNRGSEPRPIAGVRLSLRGTYRTHRKQGLVSGTCKA
jgi:hypothetical protein